MQCKWCGDVAYRKNSATWLCRKHFRFLRMRIDSKRKNKKVPSYEWLEREWDFIKGLCPICHSKMYWLRKEGGNKVVTIQHDRKGTIRLICLSCNVRHMHFKGDSFYTRNKNRKICAKCKKEKPFSDFYKLRIASNILGLNSQCKNCYNKRGLIYRNKNRKRISERAKINYRKNRYGT